MHGNVIFFFIIAVPESYKGQERFYTKSQDCSRNCFLKTELLSVCIALTGVKDQLLKTNNKDVLIISSFLCNYRALMKILGIL